MKHNYLILLVLLVFVSCSEYQKAIKSNDSAVKYEVGKKMYEKGKYAKAIILFESLGATYRTNPDGEKMYFMFADSYFKQKQYLLSAYQYESYVASFPKSDRIEEAAFTAAKCYDIVSAKYSLDQRDTEKAIEKLQNFINTYPKSIYLAEANLIMKTLTVKLEKKYFEISKQYNTISDYKAAIKALDVFMSENPGSIYREESLFLKLDSGYKLAINSIQTKKEERLINAKNYYDALIKFKNDTQYKQKADNMLAVIEKELKQFNK